MTGSISGVPGAPLTSWPRARSTATTPTPAMPVAGTSRGGSAAQATPTDAQRRQAAQQLRQYLQETGRTMKFSVDSISGKTIVRIYNSASGELVRQIPSEEIVHIADVLRAEDQRGRLNSRA